MFAAGNKNTMESSSQKINPKKKPISYGANWHYEILPRQTKKALMFLSEEKWLKESGWYLAGGTALALQAGNRKSLDLDFFWKIKILIWRNCWQNFQIIKIGC